MKLRLYNTLTRQIGELEPSREDGVVGIYTCGPTVYNYQHIGNYRTYIFEDSLRRGLDLLGYKVRHVMNVTDVGHLTSDADEGEDKMDAAARREGKTAWELAALYTRAFQEDIRKLRILEADVLCRATEHIPEQIALVRRLEEKGFTYKTSDGVYFDTSKFPDYGRLMGGARLAGNQEGARVQANPEKRNPGDFALWKLSPKDKQRQMEWDSPWGKGFPGWHIECSAMAMKYLGETFDIHCGGVDHIPVHHTNEIAQAEAATGKPFVRVWLHGEFLVLNKAKMAKSAGGFIRLADIEAKGVDALDYRYFCYGAHYRRQLEFSWEALEAAKAGRARLKERATDLFRGDGSPDPGASAAADAAMEGFKARVADDLDMPGALAFVWEALKPGKMPAPVQKELLRRVDAVLSLGLAEPSGETLSPEQQGLFDRYIDARKRKDYAASDSLRKELTLKGVRVKDTPKGSIWSRV